MWLAVVVVLELLGLLVLALFAVMVVQVLDLLSVELFRHTLVVVVAVGI
jgi:hypothetical protein